MFLALSLFYNDTTLKFPQKYFWHTLSLMTAGLYSSCGFSTGSISRHLVLCFYMNFDYTLFQLCKLFLSFAVGCLLTTPYIYKTNYQAFFECFLEFSNVFLSFELFPKFRMFIFRQANEMRSKTMQLDQCQLDMAILCFHSKY